MRSRLGDAGGTGDPSRRWPDIEPVEELPAKTSALGELMDALQSSVEAAKKKGSSKRRPA